MQIKPAVLIIDDDQDFLDVMVYHFSLNFDFVSFSKASEAISALQNGLEVDIILSDEQMPEITGVDFLKCCSQKWPDIIRIMMTGQMNNEELLRCINEAGLYGFIKKNPANDSFSEDCTNLLLNAYQERVKSQQFQFRIEEQTKTFQQKVFNERAQSVEKVAADLGYPTSIMPLFIKAASQLTQAKPATWADVQLFDSSHDEEMIQIFRHELSQLTLLLSAKTISDRENTPSDLLSESQAKASSGSPVFDTLLLCIKKLCDICGSPAPLAVDEQHRSIRFYLDGFGLSILELMCDRRDDTVIKNALLFHVVAIVHSLKGYVSFNHKTAEISGLITLPENQSTEVV